MELRFGGETGRMSHIRGPYGVASCIHFRMVIDSGNLVSLDKFYKPPRGHIFDHQLQGFQPRKFVYTRIVGISGQR